MAPKFHSTTDAFLNTQVSLAPTPVSPVADMVADIEVHMVADMKVDKVANKVADKVVDMVANIVNLMQSRDFLIVLWGGRKNKGVLLALD